MFIKRSVVVLTFLLTACGPVAAATRSVSPPPATVEIDGKTQIAGVGSYCWSNGEKPGGNRCVEMTGIPTAQQPLVSASTPYIAHFHLPLETPPSALTVSVMPASVEISGGANGLRLWNPGVGWAGALPLKNDIAYRFQESPGLYLIQLEAHWENDGNVRYGFLVQVGPATSAVPLLVTAAPTAAALLVQNISPQMRIGKGAISQLALSTDGRWLALGTPLGVYLYETSTQREVWFHPFGGYWRHLAFRPDGAQLAVGTDGNQLPILDTRTGEIVLTLTGEASLRGDWSPDGKSILTSGECEEVRVWDASGKVTHTIQPVRCNNITPGGVVAFWSGDGRRIYTLGYGGLSVWDGSNDQFLTVYTFDGDFGAIPIPSPTENLLAVSTGVSINILDAETGKVLQTLVQNPFMGAPLRAVTWSRDGKRLLAAGGRASADAENWFSIWDVKTGRLISTYKKSVGSEMFFMPDDETLVGVAPGDADVFDSISAMNLTTGKTIFSLGGFASGYAIAWDKNDLLTYTGTSLTRWNPLTGQIIAEQISPQPDWAKTDSVYAVHQRLITLANAARDVKLKQKLLNLHDTVKDSGINWSPDGKHLAADQAYDALAPAIWDVATAEMRFQLDYVGIGSLKPVANTPLIWSPDGQRLAGGGSLMNNSGDDDGFIALWDVQTGKSSALLTAGMKTERIQSLAWSPNQHWLAAGAISGKIFLWDVQKQSLVAVLNGHASDVLNLSWSPDGTWLASSGEDGTVLVWKMP